MTRERILRAALDIVDREGLSAITMQRVGEEVGVEAMSLYNHVPSKAAILDGLFEVVLEELPKAKKSASFERVLRERARSLRTVLRAHPNALPLFATRPAVTQASLAHVESVLDVLHKAAFSTDDAISAMHVLVAYVVGHTVATYAPSRADEISRPLYERLPELEFPRVREAARLLATHDVEREFELGLSAMLAGLALFGR